MKKNIFLFFLLFVLLLLTSCGHSYSMEETENIFTNNQELFYKVVDICVTNDLRNPVADWQFLTTSAREEENQKVNNLSKEDKAVLQKLIDLGVENISYQDPQYQSVNFYVQYTNSSQSQGIIVLLENSTVNVTDFLDDFLQYHADYEYKALNDRVYYYRGWGDYRQTDISE